MRVLDTSCPGLVRGRPSMSLSSRRVGGYHVTELRVQMCGCGWLNEWLMSEEYTCPYLEVGDKCQ